jgi:putative oxidoreductase
VTRFLFPGFPGGRVGLGLLVVRLVVGAAFILHGWPKIQNPTGWMPPEAPIPGFLQAAAAVAEFGGGIAWLLGALTPLFSFLLFCTMGFAAFGVHMAKGDPFVSQGGPSYELALVYFAVSVLLLLAGPGQCSVDYCLFGRGRSVGGGS